MSQNLKLQLVTPDRSIFDGEVEQFTAPGAIGPFTVLKNHAPIVSALVPGVFSFTEQGREGRYFISGGFIEFHENQATVLASASEPVEQIDRARAERAKARAEQRLQRSSDATIDHERARQALERAQGRLAAISPIGG